MSTVTEVSVIDYERNKEYLDSDVEYEEVLNNIDDMDDKGVDLVDELKKVKIKKYSDKLIKNIDYLTVTRQDGDVHEHEEIMFDSAHIVWVPLIQAQFKLKLRRIRARRMGLETSKSRDSSKADDFQSKIDSLRLSGQHFSGTLPPIESGRSDKHLNPSSAYN